MHSPDATWETTLVIPETAKPIDVQTLDALLRIEELLQKLVRAKALEDLAELDGETLSMSQFASKEDLEEYKAATAPKAKGKRSNGK
jgi:hypothetical protein